jgi:hypothetical protein
MRIGKFLSLGLANLLLPRLLGSIDNPFDPATMAARGNSLAKFVGGMGA